jgi:hypothetical protein
LERNIICIQIAGCGKSLWKTKEMAGNIKMGAQEMGHEMNQLTVTTSTESWIYGELINDDDDQISSLSR